MQRRKLLSLIAATAVITLTGCAAQRLSSTTGSVVVANISARSARELARPHGMINRRPLPVESRRLLQEGQKLAAAIPLQALPKEFIEDLPKVAGHEWRAAGIDLFLVNTETQVIASILRGPLR